MLHYVCESFNGEEERNMNEKSMQFLQIAMKHLPEAKAILDDNGIALDMEKAQPVLELLMKVMNEAYELGKADRKNKKHLFKMEERPEPWIEAVRGLGENQIYEEAKEKVVRKTL